MRIAAPIFLSLLSACSAGDPAHTRSSQAGSAVPAHAMVLDFQTGFVRTPVEVRVNGRQVFSGVLSTDNRVGLARRVEVPVQDAAALEVEIVIDRADRYAYQIEPGRGRHVGFLKDLDSGKLQMQQRQRPFEYD